MRKKHVSYQRILAVMLVLSLVFSNFSGISITAYAEETENTYIGDVSEENGRVKLTINAGVMENFSNDTLVGILNARMEAGDRYQEVEVLYPSIDNVIPETVWNSVVGVLQADDYTNANFCFMAGEEGPNENWAFTNPTVTEADVNTDVVISICGKNQGVGFKVASEVFPAENASICLDFNSTNTNLQAFVEAMGNWGVWKVIDAAGNNSNVNVEYTWDTENFTYASCHIYNPDALNANEDYTIVENIAALYSGDVYSWTDEEGYEYKYLTINPLEMQRETFSTREITDILQVNEEKSFDVITIKYPERDTNVIYKDVVNSAVAYLKDGSLATKCLKFFFYDEINGISKEWNLYAPTANQAEDVLVDLDIIISEDNKVGVKLNANRDSLSANSADMYFCVESGSNLYTYIKNILGEESKQYSVGNNITYCSYYIDEYSISISIDDISNFNANEVYTIGERVEGEEDVYSGYVNSWIDEEGYEHTYLEIDPLFVEKESFTTEEIISILKMHEEKSFDRITIVYPDSDSNIIYKDVVNTAIAYLKGQEATKNSLLFRFNDDKNYISKMWELYNPTANQAEDVVTDAEIFISEDNKVSISVNADEEKFSAESYELSFAAHSSSNLYEGIKKILGEQNRAYVVGDNLAECWYSVSEYGAWFYISDISSLNANEAYAIGEKKYLGDVDYYEEEAYLYISAEEMGKETLTSADVKGILQYYKDEQMAFDSISFEQFYSDNNVILKDAVNMGRELLKENARFGTNISFVFSSKPSPDYVGLVNAITYEFSEPDMLASDVKVDAKLNVGSKGIVLNATKNKSLKNVTLRFALDESLDITKELKDRFGTDDNYDIVMVNGEYKIQNVDYINCWTLSDAGTYLVIYGNSDYMTGQDMLLCDVNYWGEVIPVGESKIITLEKPVDAGTKVTWKSLDSEVATVSDSGEVTALDSGEVLIFASYYSGGKAYAEIWKSNAFYEVRKIAFNKSELTMELQEEGSDWYNTAYLDVIWYPSSAELSTDELVWTTSDANVVDFDRADDGTITGYIKAVSEGTAVIRVTYSDEIYAECTVTVEKPVVIPENEWPTNINLIMNMATTLSDAVGLPENWSWKYPDTKLSAFANMDGHEFTAVYTAKDGRTVDKRLWVPMTTITGISIEASEISEGEVFWVEKPKALTDGESVVLNYNVETLNEEFAWLGGYEDRVKFQWSSSPAGIGTQDGLEGYDENSYKFTADRTKPGKKTFTLSMIDSKTGKVLAKDSYTLVVTEEKTVDLDVELGSWMEYTSDNSGVMHFELDRTVYYPLTVKSADTSVLTIGKATVEETDTQIDTIVPFTFKKTGAAYVTVTAADEIKSSAKVKFIHTESKPDVLKSTLNINKAMTKKADSLIIHPQEIYPIANNDNVTLSGENADKFNVEFVETQGNRAYFAVNLTDASLKKGNYKLDLNVPVRVDEESGETRNYTYKVTIKVTDSLPKVAIKQAEKVNLFYTDEEGAGEVTIVANGARVTETTLGDSCDYILERVDDTDTYSIRLKEGTTGNDKKGTLSFRLEGYDAAITKSFTVKTVTKAPVIEVIQKPFKLYPTVNYRDAYMLMRDKATGELVYLDSVVWVAGKNTTSQVTREGIKANLKNNYILGLMGEGDEAIGIYFTLLTEKAATDKFEFQVKNSNWIKPVSVKYTLNVITKAPKLELGQNKLVLNKNEEIYPSQQLSTSIGYDDNSFVLSYDTNVRIVGVDKKSKDVLNESLVLNYNSDWGEVVASLNDNNLAKGNYKYKIIADNNKRKSETTLTVSVVDVAPEKCVKVNKKGSLDVLDRTGNYITYSPKLTNISGNIMGAYLEGPDANLFNTYFNVETQCLQVYLSEGQSYSTKNTYKVQPVFVVDGGREGCPVETTMQSIKVKQGKPKVTVKADSNVLYSNAENELCLNVSALLKDKEVAISDIKLANYTDDIWVNYYDSETKQLSISKYADKDILKYGKSWNLKFKVIYRDKAGNEKDSVVTYKVVVK